MIHGLKFKSVKKGVKYGSKLLEMIRKVDKYNVIQFPEIESREVGLNIDENVLFMQFRIVLIISEEAKEEKIDDLIVQLRDKLEQIVNANIAS